MPLIIGIVRKRVALGVAGFATTVVAGFILGLILAIPSALVWTVIIFVVGPGDSGERQLRRRREYDEFDDADYDERYSDRDFLPPKRDPSEPPDDRYRSGDR